GDAGFARRAAEEGRDHRRRLPAPDGEHAGGREAPAAGHGVQPEGPDGPARGRGAQRGLGWRRIAPVAGPARVLAPAHRREHRRAGAGAALGPAGVRQALVPGALGLLLLAGCQREEDPAKAGFFSGLGNTVSGTYERRLDDRQRELSETERLRQDMAA